MNETIKTILGRRSIRAYQPRQIGEEELQNILLAGQYAPTAMGQQPWHFTVLQNSDLLEKLQVQCKSLFLHSDNENLRAVASREEYHVFHHAPTLLIPEMFRLLPLCRIVSWQWKTCWLPRLRSISAPAGFIRW